MVSPSRRPARAGLLERTSARPRAASRYPRRRMRARIGCLEGRRFYLALGLLALLGFALRVLYGKVGNYPRGIGDFLYYHLLANGLANGHGFNEPLHSVG